MPLDSIAMLVLFAAIIGLQLLDSYRNRKRCKAVYSSAYQSGRRSLLGQITQLESELATAKSRLEHQRHTTANALEAIAQDNGQCSAADVITLSRAAKCLSDYSKLLKSLGRHNDANSTNSLAITCSARAWVLGAPHTTQQSKDAA